MAPPGGHPPANFHLNTSAAGAGAGLAGTGAAGVGLAGAGLAGTAGAGLAGTGAAGAASGAQAASTKDASKTRIRPILQSNVNFLLFTLDLQMILSQYFNSKVFYLSKLSPPFWYSGLLCEIRLDVVSIGVGA